MNAGTLPEYFRRDAGGWTPIAASEVPASTNLAQQHFPALSPSSWPALDSTAMSAWTSNKWAAGPFTTRLNDGSTVTYVWYRFVDQPAIARLGLDAATLRSLQACVERLHAQYGMNGPTMLAPTAGRLVGIDSGMLVMPPPGLAVGYVPIAIGQHCARLASAWWGHPRWSIARSAPAASHPFVSSADFGAKPRIR